VERNPEGQEKEENSQNERTGAGAEERGREKSWERGGMERMVAGRGK
jgi:hypothetical protein